MNTFDRIIAVVQAHKWQFLLVFFAIYTLTYALLVIIDFIPEPVSSEDEIPATLVETASAAEISDFDPFTAVQLASAGTALPVSVVREEAVSLAIPNLNRTVRVVTANSNSLTDLDTALLSGVVRHPDSAKLGEEGNVVILGHSSYLPNVLNRNFQALNGAQNLEWGDVITIDSDTTRYTYMVKRVYKAKASEAVIPTEGVGTRLTLVTCNSFATADDRFIIEADLLTTEPL